MYGKTIRAVCVGMIGFWFACQMNQSENTWTLKSPNGNLKVNILHRNVEHAVRSDSTQTELAYQVVFRDKHIVMPYSPLGIARVDQQFESGLVLVNEKHEKISESYLLPHGKKRECEASANEIILTFQNKNKALMSLIVRAYDDGIAFRYHFPGKTDSMKTIVRERTGFHIPDEAVGYLQPCDNPGMYTPAYEHFYQKDVPVGTPSPLPGGWCFPALFRIENDNYWLLISEAGLDATYCGSRLAAHADDNVYRIRFPDPGEGNGIGAVLPTTTLPWSIPWRVIIVGNSLATIFESTLINDVSPASNMMNTAWIKPGRVSWSWWSESDSPKDINRLRDFVDLAAEMGWEYSLVDANWNIIEEDELIALAEYAKKKGVGLLFWYNSGGPHNSVTEAPRDRMMPVRLRRQEFRWLQEIGIKGVKIDFFQSDKQKSIQNYLSILKDAADYRLMVDFHGCTLPRGWSRTYPHLMTMEAVRGAEMYKFEEIYPRNAPWHNTVLAFTRNVVGSMDYTPVTFSDSQYPHLTTVAHELALSVVFESGLQHFADGVESYRQQPDFVKQFLKTVPVAWDESKLIDGMPGKDIIVARRHADVWYIAGINGEDHEKNFHIDFDFMNSGHYALTLIGDSNSVHTFRNEKTTIKSGKRLTVPVLGYGGFVIELHEI
ncbi:glycoside hydrolase family 97 catalytic domain-containing protein [candidate division KSB1 bacterium]|nr:glycoside hydrolase family 97 catalytic domain-containing protein [candidate division KSB1 bacterium]